MRTLLAAKRLITIAVSLTLSAPIFAGFDEGLAAYNAGDYQTAKREWVTAAKQGNAGAQYRLGGMYDNGQGVPQNDAEAVKWYRLAAVQGNAGAQTDLGFMFSSGRGVPQNYVVAYALFNLARAKNQNGMASVGINIISKRISTSDIVRAQELSTRLNVKGAFTRELDKYLKSST